MAVPARLEEVSDPSGRPRDPRLQLRLELSGVLPTGDAADVTVHNISRTGMLIECRHALSAGQKLSVDLPQAASTEAAVVWSSGSLHGLQFAGELPIAVLSAAQLRGAVGTDFAIAGSAHGQPGESFGIRLQRLRKARGLSLAQLAGALEVSKPTVWAWEQDRAKPTAGRMDRLAEVLGTSRQSLHSGRDDNALEEVLEKSRRQIAAVYGIGHEKVRIMIEL